MSVRERENNFAAFLSYHTPDQSAVLAVRKQLEARGIATFLDREDLKAGLPWPQILEQTLKGVSAVLVFIGPEGLGLWQKRETAFALSRQVEEEKAGRMFPVIPVLLRGADIELGFLFTNTWVDLRRDLEDPRGLDVLVGSIGGQGVEKETETKESTILPFQGLQSFGEDHAAFFFGREAFTGRLLNTVLGRRLVGVVGPSGSGKSSVVQAGLLPALRRQRPPHDTWDVAIFTPGERPFHRLAAAFVPLLEPELSASDRLAETGKLGELLATGTTTLKEVVDLILERSEGTSRLLVVGDQFEELFTSTPAELRRPFVTSLLDTLDRAPLTLVLTLRADFYGHILSLSRGLSDLLERGLVNLGPMTREEIEDAIVAPGRLAGLAFDDGLVERILDDVGDEPGNLPLLEFALTELWHRRKRNRLTFDVYRDIGGVSGAIADRTEAEYDKLTHDQREAARKLFTRLVRVALPDTGAADTRQRIALADLEEEIRPVVRGLTDARLIVTSAGLSDEGPVLEVAHEAVIGHWDRLQGWLNEDREFLLWRQRLDAFVAERARNPGDEGSLLRGTVLGEAENWHEKRAQDLNEAERELIDLSLAARHHEEEGKRRRRRNTIGGLVAGLLAVALIAVFAGIQWRQSVHAQRQAESQREIAVRNENEAKAQRAIARSGELAARSVSLIDEAYDRALLISLESLTWAPTFRAKSALFRNLLAHSHLERFLRGHVKPISPGAKPVYRQAAAFHPEGQYAAILGMEGSHSVLVMDLSTGRPVSRFSTGEGEVRAITFSPDGEQILGATEQGEVHFWDSATGKTASDPLRSGEKCGHPMLQFYSDGDRLLLKCRSLIIWQLPTRSEINRLTFKNSPLTVAMKPDGSLLVAGSGQNEKADYVRIKDMRSGAERILKDARLESSGGLIVALSPDGNTVAAGGSRTNPVVTWDLRKLAPRGHELGVVDGIGVNSLVFSPDGRHLMAAGDGPAIHVWDMGTGKRVPVELRHQSTKIGGGIEWLAASPDGERLLSYAFDEAVLVWNLAKPRTLAKRISIPNLELVGFDDAGKLRLLSRFDGTGRVTDEENNPLLEIAGIDNEYYTSSGAFSPNGKMLALCGSNQVNLYEVDGNRDKHVIPGFTDSGICPVAFGGKGGYVAIGEQGGGTSLYDSASGTLRKTLKQHEQETDAVALDPSERFLASANRNGLITLWDIAVSSIVFEIAEPRLRLEPVDIYDITFSDNGSMLAVGLNEGYSIISSVDGTILKSFDTGSALGAPVFVDFSPDGEFFAWARSGSGEVQIEHATGRDSIGPAMSAGNSVWSIAFSPDGKRLVARQDAGVTIWDMDLESWREHACAVANRNLTIEEWKQFFGEEPYRRSCPALPEPGAQER